ncbi:MAG TPA: hypothetical protein VGS57_19830, partial [Thermoanaerobaculia bacterium]|nr:hypothetical protein [Thermoanaerobaculia bacterium]
GDPTAGHGEGTLRADLSQLREKVVAETALLLLCVAPIRDLDERIRERFDAIADLLVPLARGRDLLAAICLDPGLACDHAVAHILLSRLGHVDLEVDHLLAQATAGVEFGPERLPHRRLEQAWLARMQKRDGMSDRGRPSQRLDSRLIADSMLGRPLDALGASRMDVYAFTHSVMYASDLGERRFRLPRSRTRIAEDSDAALARALDTNDFDLAAELLLAWPMLGLRWTAAAAFAFRVLAHEEDQRGFLPGSTFDVARYQSLGADERTRYMLLTCYHTVYVWGFLCALALRPGCAPPSSVPPTRRARGAAVAISALLDIDDASCWRKPFDALSHRQQDALSPLLLALLLRRARAAADLGLIRQALELALAHGLAHGPAPQQAAALLRRTRALRL